ncbi:MAG: S8 family serine peptidase [Desulfobacterales bacterium]|nr:S8 family serine peptidase [Desulfobacterales bacterium]
MRKDRLHLPPYRVERVPMALAQEELSNWGMRRMRIKEIWEKGIEGKGVRVAILDTGLPNHPDIEIEKSVNFSDDPIRDKNLHSTWVTGCIGADGRFKGIAPKCKLYIAKILGDDGSGDWTWLEKGLLWAEQEECEVINVSAGGDYTGTRIQPILKRLADKGIIVVCAGGNEANTLLFPANNKHTVAVGAINKLGEKAPFSNFGPRLVIMAPGVELLGCWLDGSYAKVSGTSMATPMVSGVLTLEEQKHALSLTEAILRFAFTSEEIERVGWEPDSGWGTIAAHEFLLLKKFNKQITMDWAMSLAMFIFAYYVGEEEQEV